MIFGIALVVVGAILFFFVPFIGLIPGALMMVFGGILVVLNLVKTGARTTAVAAKAAHRASTTKPCPDCKTRIPADATVCAACGHRYASNEATPQEAIATTASAVASDTCGHCGSDVKANSKFCTKCGLARVATTA